MHTDSSEASEGNLVSETIDHERRRANKVFHECSPQDRRGRARLAGVGIDTVRFYEREGLLPKAPRRASVYRQYPPGTVERIRFIRRAKSLGFTLRDIHELLALRGARKAQRGTPGVAAHTARTQRAHVREFASATLAKLEVKIGDLQRMKRALEEITCACAAGDRVSTVHECPIIEALEGGIR